MFKILKFILKDNSKSIVNIMCLQVQAGCVDYAFDFIYNMYDLSLQVTSKYKHFRFRDSDSQALESLTARINHLKKDGRSVNHTDVVRGLLRFGQKAEPSEIFSEIKETF